MALGLNAAEVEFRYSFAYTNLITGDYTTRVVQLTKVTDGKEYARVVRRGNIMQFVTCTDLTDAMTETVWWEIDATWFEITEAPWVTMEFIGD
jgi:hypothetical protein